jgi:RHS repeat-associated protein
VSGSVIETCTNWPFGDGQTCTPSDYDPLHFATSLRDLEDNQDHFWFRQYFSAKGVWTSPDPAGMMAANAGNPQSWNRYAYSGDNPVTYFDPFGLQNTKISAIPDDHGGCAIMGMQMPCSIVGALISSGLAFPASTSAGPCEQSQHTGAVFCGDPNIDAPRTLFDPATFVMPATGIAASFIESSGPGNGFCSNIPSTGASYPFRTSTGELRLQFNGSGNLTGIGVQLTGPNDIYNGSGLRIGPNTFVGYSLGSQTSITAGFSNPVLVKGSWGINASIQSATFSNGTFSSVNGSVALGGVSVPLTSSLLRWGANRSDGAKGVFTSMLQGANSISNRVTCASLFGK